MLNTKTWVPALASLFLFVFASVALIHRQESLAIAGNTIFSGLFERKVQQYFEILLAISIFNLFALLIWLRRKWLIYIIERLSANTKVARKHSESFTYENMLRVGFFAVLFSLGIITISYFSAPDRWIHSGFRIELIFYAIVLMFVYIGSYSFTNSFWQSALFPAIAFFLFAHQALGINGMPIIGFGISPDSYHSGEYYIPAKLLSEGFSGFFDDYNPSRGLTNYYPAFISLLLSDPVNFERLAFYELTAVRFILVSASFFLFTGMGIYARITTCIFLGTYFTGGIFSAVALLIPVTWFVCRTFNLGNPIQTIFVLTTASYVVVMHSAGEGVIWSIVVFLVLLPQLLLNWRKFLNFGAITWLLISLMVGAYFVLVTYTAPNLIEYVRGNGSLNTAAHAIQHSSDFRSEIGFIKYGFIYLTVVLFALSIYFFQKSKPAEANFALVIVGVVIVGLIRFMGRDDPGALSRPFAGTILACIAVFVMLTMLISLVKSTYKFGLIGICTALLLNFGWFGQFGDRVKDLSFLSFAGVQFDDTFPDNVEESIASINIFSEMPLHSCEHLVDLTGNNSILALSNKLSVIPTTSSYNAVSRYEQRAIIETLRHYAQDGGVCLRILHQNIDHDGGGLFLRAPELGEFIFNEMDLIDVGNLLSVTGVWLEAGTNLTHRENGSLNLMEERQALNDYSSRFTNLMFLPVTWGRVLSQDFYVEPVITEGRSIPESLRGRLTFGIFSRADELTTPDVCVLTRRSSDGFSSELTFRSEGRGLYAVPLYGHSHWYLGSDISMEWNCPGLQFHGYTDQDALFTKR